MFMVRGSEGCRARYVHGCKELGRDGEGHPPKPKFSKCLEHDTSTTSHHQTQKEHSSECHPRYPSDGHCTVINNSTQHDTTTHRQCEAKKEIEKLPTASGLRRQVYTIESFDSGVRAASSACVGCRAFAGMADGVLETAESSKFYSCGRFVVRMRRYNAAVYSVSLETTWVHVLLV